MNNSFSEISYNTKQTNIKIINIKLRHTHLFFVFLLQVIWFHFFIKRKKKIKHTLFEQILKKRVNQNKTIV